MMSHFDEVILYHNLLGTKTACFISISCATRCQSAMAQGQHDVDMASAKMCIFMLFSNTPSQLPPPPKKKYYYFLFQPSLKIAPNNSSIGIYDKQHKVMAIIRPGMCVILKFEHGT